MYVKNGRDAYCSSILLLVSSFVGLEVIFDFCEMQDTEIYDSVYYFPRSRAEYVSAFFNKERLFFKMDLLLL